MCSSASPVKESMNGCEYSQSNTHLPSELLPSIKRSMTSSNVLLEPNKPEEMKNMRRLIAVASVPHLVSSHETEFECCKCKQTCHKVWMNNQPRPVRKFHTRTNENIKDQVRLSPIRPSFVPRLERKQIGSTTFVPLDTVVLQNNSDQTTTQTIPSRPTHLPQPPKNYHGMETKEDLDMSPWLMMRFKQYKRQRQQKKLEHFENQDNKPNVYKRSIVRNLFPTKTTSKMVQQSKQNSCSWGSKLNRTTERATDPEIEPPILSNDSLYDEDVYMCSFGEDDCEMSIEEELNTILDLNVPRRPSMKRPLHSKCGPMVIGRKLKE